MGDFNLYPLGLKVSPSYHTKPGGPGLLGQALGLPASISVPKPDAGPQVEDAAGEAPPPFLPQDQLLPGPPEEVIIVSLQKAPGCQDENMEQVSLSCL